MNESNTSTPYASSKEKAKFLLQNKEGVTIVRSTGHVFNPGKGYLVGGASNDSLVLEPYELEHKLEQAEYQVARWIDRQPFNYGSAPQYIGVWIDTDTGRVHLDLSTYYESRVEAESVGVARKEIAIWDCGNVMEVRL